MPRKMKSMVLNAGPCSDEQNLHNVVEAMNNYVHRNCDVGIDTGKLQYKE